MQEFNVSQSTITRALNELESDGIIIRKWGVGILAAGKENSITVLQRPGNGTIEKARKVLFSYAAYYSGGLWNALNSVEQYAVQRRVNVLFHKRTQATSMEEFVDYVKSCKKLAGVIYCEDTHHLSEKELALLGALPCKVILHMSPFVYPELPPNVYIGMPDESAAGRMMAKYLFKRGHRRIGIIAHSPKTDGSEAFFNGILAYYKDHDAKIEQEWIFRSGTRPWEDSLAAATQSVRAHINEIRAAGLTTLVFSSADGALAGIRPLRDNALSVPEDVGIAGHGDMPLFANLPDAPATVFFDPAEAVAPAIEIILARKKCSIQRFRIEPHFKCYNGVSRCEA